MEWVHGVGLPAVVLSSGLRILAMNRHAEELFGVDRGHWQRIPCFDVVRGTDLCGNPFCQRDCAVKQRIEAREGCPAIELECRAGAHGTCWLQVISIPWHIGTTEFQIVHLFNDVSRSHRLWEYIRLIAHRFSDLHVDASVPPESILTRRESEILGHLTLDEEPRRIAHLLSISPATVRNHVRNILDKIGVHSIQEAVALHLLFDDVSATVPGTSRACPRARARDAGTREEGSP